MDIIIDGYNVIGGDQGLRSPLEQKRDWLIHRLSVYKSKKQFGIIVVFDGWRSGGIRQAEDTQNGVKVVYSRQGEKADEVIIRLARQKGSGCVVVTSDRAVRSAVERFGVAAIYASEFNHILHNSERPNTADEDDDSMGLPSRTGSAGRASKSERRRQEKLKKLRF